MSRLEDIKEFFKTHQDKFILTIGFILVCIISFSLGRLTIISKSKPIKIDESKVFENTDTKSSEETANNIEGENNTIDVIKEENEGVFVADIENSQYYPFNSEEVGDIPKDNRMWFDSQEEAEEQGYILAKSSETNTNKSSKAATDLINDTKSENNDNCKYVGSKNSDKYHALDSGPAKRIKEENRVCFSSQEDAESQGYTPGSSIKD